MAASPDTMPPLSTLSRWGMADYSVRAVEFDKPVGNRGLHEGLKPVSWKVTITSLSASRPMVIAIRPDIDEAERDARARFLLLFRDKKMNTAPVSEGPAAPKKPKAPVAAPMPDDTDDLI